VGASGRGGVRGRWMRIARPDHGEPGRSGSVWGRSRLRGAWSEPGGEDTADRCGSGGGATSTIGSSVRRSGQPVLRGAGARGRGDCMPWFHGGGKRRGVILRIPPTFPNVTGDSVRIRPACPQFRPGLPSGVARVRQPRSSSRRVIASCPVNAANESPDALSVHIGFLVCVLGLTE
jgi:hypothetical protein